MGNSATESEIGIIKKQNKQELLISSGSSAYNTEFGKVSRGEERAKVLKRKCFPDSFSK